MSDTTADGVRSVSANPLRSGFALDAFNFVLALMQTAFGAFVPAFLAEAGWSQAQIGSLLSLDTVTSLISQAPAGWLVDHVLHRRFLLACAAALIAAAALLYAMPFAPLAVAAVVLHAIGSAVTGPGIAAISLVLVGHTALDERLGRNVRFAAIGALTGAAVMGLLSLWTQRAAFLLALVLAAPAVLALRAITPPPPAFCPPMHGHLREHAEERTTIFSLMSDHRLVVFALCVVLFHLASAAVVPLALGTLARQSGGVSGLLIASFVVVPQLVVAVASPAVGRAAQRLGRRPVLLLGFAALPLRALLFAIIGDPTLLALVQVLDGVGGAVFGVMLPLVTADLTRGTGRFNLTLGLNSLAVAAGAAISNFAAGQVATHWGTPAAFLLLCACGIAGVATVALLMPETRHDDVPATE